MLTADQKRRFRALVVEALIDHQMLLDERRSKRTKTTWPDESDIYSATVARMRALFKKQLRAEGWTPTKQLAQYVDRMEMLLCAEWHGGRWPHCTDDGHKQGRTILAALHGQP